MLLILKNLNKQRMMRRIFQQMEFPFPFRMRRSRNSHLLQVVTILIVISLFPQTAKSQWLQDLRTNHYNSLTVQFWKAQEINETATSYKDGNEEVTQTQITFSVDRRQINQSVTKDGIKVESNVYSFNPRKQILGKTLRRSTNGTQWSFEKYIYAYQGSNLTSVNSVKITGELIYILVVKNDSLGIPIMVKQLSPDSTLIATEICSIDKSKNKVSYQVTSAGGSIISTSEGRLVVKKTGKEKYNLHGDCYFFPRNDSPTDNTFCRVEFDYDSNGNWIKKEVYEGVVNSQGKLTDSTLVTAYKRKIKYIKQE